MFCLPGEVDDTSSQWQSPPVNTQQTSGPDTGVGLLPTKAEPVRQEEKEGRLRASNEST